MMLNRQPYLPLGLMLLISLALLKLPARTALQAKLAVGSLFLPLFALTASAQELGDKAGSLMVSHTELARQLDTLRRENEALKLRLREAQGILLENQRLRTALQVRGENPRPMRLARVTGRDPANWWRSIRINLGLRDGIPTNAPVVTPEGLVGRVAEVGYDHARVVLLGDPDCGVSVLIQETRDHGVISPDSANPIDNILVEIRFLSRNSTLRAGQRVVTSGLGGIFPKDILIGQVVDFHSVDFGLYNEARVRVAAPLNALEEVWVLTP